VTGDIHSPVPNITEWPFEWLGERSARRMSAALSGASMAVLHYVNYGFATRGCPFWLARAIEEWARDPKNRLVTIFHELYATGPVWTSAFWLSASQRSIARRIASASVASIATRQVVAAQIASWLPGSSTVVLPIMSTIGEVSEPAPLATRKRRLVIFGGSGMRLRAYERAADLRRVCERLGIEEIVDIGPALPSSPEPLPSVRQTSMGILGREQISGIMATSLAGYVSYHPGCLAKSSIFAAYTAHGLLPITSDDHKSEADGLVAGTHYLAADDNGLAMRQDVASAAHRWYREHGVSVYADTIAGLLTGGRA
jgi:hypothetical protein